MPTYLSCLHFFVTFYSSELFSPRSPSNQIMILTSCHWLHNKVICLSQDFIARSFLNFPCKMRKVFHLFNSLSLLWFWYLWSKSENLHHFLNDVCKVSGLFVYLLATISKVLQCTDWVWLFDELLIAGRLVGWLVQVEATVTSISIENRTSKSFIWSYNNEQRDHDSLFSTVHKLEIRFSSTNHWASQSQTRAFVCFKSFVLSPAFVSILYLAFLCLSQLSYVLRLNFNLAGKLVRLFLLAYSVLFRIAHLLISSNPSTPLMQLSLHGHTHPPSFHWFRRV